MEVIYLREINVSFLYLRGFFFSLSRRPVPCFNYVKIFRYKRERGKKKKMKDNYAEVFVFFFFYKKSEAEYYIASGVMT